MGMIADTLNSIHWHIKQINEFDVYSGNSTHSLHNNYVYRYALPFEKIDDPVGATLFLQRYWYHSITISVVYFIIIKLIQRFMRDREAFVLKRPLVIWNASLAIFSAIGFIRFGEDLVYSVFNLGMYRSVCYTVHPKGVAAFWALLFALSKIVELGDTLFIVLRKRKLIFLHYYHHVAVLIGSAHAGAEHAAPGRFFITVNYFVHAIMYSYYASTSYGFRPSKYTFIIHYSLTHIGILVQNLKKKKKIKCFISKIITSILCTFA
uniref:Elongation of very long chain fatty acids protein n=1 Tax=Ascaris lumbricoides TaxID=6252 RepID=A0A0M3IUK0_ASCLU